MFKKTFFKLKVQYEHLDPYPVLALKKNGDPCGSGSATLATMATTFTNTDSQSQCCGSVTFWYGSEPLTNGSGFGFGSCYFRQRPSRY
jgi:hypothetical protein